MYLSLYLIGTFTDSNVLHCNAMHRAMYCTEFFSTLESESVFELVKAEAGSWKRCCSKIVVVKRYGTGTKTGISSSSSSDV